MRSKLWTRTALSLLLGLAGAWAATAAFLPALRVEELVVRSRGQQPEF
jgi:hypothetical protein